VVRAVGHQSREVSISACGRDCPKQSPPGGRLQRGRSLSEAPGPPRLASAPKSPRLGSDIPVAKSLPEAQSGQECPSHSNLNHPRYSLSLPSPRLCLGRGLGDREVAGLRRCQTPTPYMFDSCHLDPEPDAQLHILLANLMQAADTLRGDDNHYPGVHRVHQSLKAYSETFKHPGWKPVSHTD